jgi:hypothetical protein
MGPGLVGLVLLAGLAGCVGGETDEDKSTSHSGTPVEPPYGVPAHSAEGDADTDADADVDTTGGHTGTGSGGTGGSGP